MSSGDRISRAKPPSIFGIKGYDAIEILGMRRIAPSLVELPDRRFFGVMLIAIHRHSPLSAFDLAVLRDRRRGRPAHLGQKLGRFLQIPGVVSFGEPVVDRRQQRERFGLLAAAETNSRASVVAARSSQDLAACLRATAIALRNVAIASSG